MRALFRLTILFGLLLLSPAKSEELSIYNSSGKPVAYVAENLTIFLWGGKPVAYLTPNSDDGSSFHIYRFSGAHIGWFEQGIMWNHDGYAVGSLKGGSGFEPFKGFKQFEPFKGFTQPPPAKPVFTSTWSNIPLELFLGSN